MYRERHFLLRSSPLISSSLQENNLFLSLWIRVINFCLPCPTLLYGCRITCMLQAAYLCYLTLHICSGHKWCIFQVPEHGLLTRGSQNAAGFQTWLHPLLLPDPRLLARHPLPTPTQEGGVDTQGICSCLLAFSENYCKTLYSCLATCSIPIFFSQIPVPPFF